MIPEEELSDERLLDTIDEVYKNRSRYIEAMEKSPLGNAVETIVGLLDELSGNKHNA